MTKIPSQEAYFLDPISPDYLQKTFKYNNKSPDYFRLSVEQSRCLVDLCYTLSASDILYSDTSEVKFSNDQQTTSLQINISFKTEHTLRAVVRLYNIINDSLAGGVFLGSHFS
jgi:hypothetical protein